MVPESVTFSEYFFSRFYKLLHCGKSIYKYPTIQIIPYSTLVITLQFHAVYRDKDRVTSCRLAYQ
jgi:hypothetical protein